MKYKVGDRVKIKSIEWYNENRSKSHGTVICGDKYFGYDMREWCGKTMTILSVYSTCYTMAEDGAKDWWTDEMIEGLVESLEDRMKDLRKMCTISLTDSKYSDKIEVLLNDYEYIEEGDKAYFIKKKTKYPKTYEECCKVFGLNHYLSLGWNSYDVYSGVINCLPKQIEDIAKKLESLSKLLICRDAYWKIAGEEMGLGKPWKPDWNNEKQDKHGFYNEVKYTIINSATFVFPTAEMRDTFYENFKTEIECCKEL